MIGDCVLLNRYPLSNYCFESIPHGNMLLDGLNDLRNRDLLLDVTLLVDGKPFKAHRAVLAACSDYFRAMFTDAMKESKQNEITLTGVSAKGIELLLDYAYTSKIEINSGNILDVLSTASYIQMDAVVDACTDYLQSQLTIENCVDITTVSETYSIRKLTRNCYRFMCAHLYDFSKTNEIDRLTWQQFNRILSCDFPVNCTEEIVLSIVLKWIHSQKVDIKIAHGLLTQIHLNVIPRANLELILNESLFPRGSPVCISTISLAKSRRYKEKNFGSRIQFGTGMVNNRGIELALVNVGGFRSAGITNEITYYLPSIKKWHHLTSIPHVEQCNYGTAVNENLLFVVGGCYNVCLKEYIHPFGFCYNPIIDKWIKISPMLKDRCRFSLNFVGDYLYAISGVSEMEDQETEYEETNCERYDPDKDQWEYIANFPDNRSQHAGASHMEFLYISGGLERDVVLSSFWRYDTIKKCWEQMPDMLNPRADHAILEIDRKLFVCGGWFEDNQSENRRLVETIDMFDPTTHEWKIVTTIPTPKYHAGIVANDMKIYIIGGFYSDSNIDRASSTIEFYDIQNNEWSNLDKYPVKNWECSCVSLYIPKSRDDLQDVTDANDA